MKLAVIIPAFNEATVIGDVLQAIPRRLPSVSRIDVIVVDDGSKDHTSVIAKKYSATVLRHHINRGLGGALGTGLTYARDENYELAVTMDADGQHDPTELSKIVEPILSGKADMVIGTRLKESNGMPLIRRIGVWGFNAITYLLFGVWTTDSHSGFRAFSRRALDVMEFNLRGMEVSPGFFAEVERHRLRFAEVPIRAIYTDYSVTKGQRPLRSAFAILFRLLWHKLIK